MISYPNTNSPMKPLRWRNLPINSPQREKLVSRGHQEDSRQSNYRNEESSLTLCFNAFFPTKGNTSVACDWTAALTLPSSLSKSGTLRRNCATSNIISACSVKASTTLSLLLISSTSFNGWQIQLLRSRFPAGVIQLSRYLKSVPETRTWNQKKSGSQYASLSQF